MKKLVLATVGVALIAVLAAAMGTAKPSGPTHAQAAKLSSANRHLMLASIDRVVAFYELCGKSFEATLWRQFRDGQQ